MSSEKTSENPLGAVLLELRESMGLQRTPFASRLGVSYKTIEKYETVKFSAAPAMIWKIAELAREAGRPDLAAKLSDVVVRRFEGATHQIKMATLPMSIAQGLDALRADILWSKNPAADIQAALDYLRWRRAAHPEDVALVEEQIKRQRGEGTD